MKESKNLEIERNEAQVKLQLRVKEADCLFNITALDESSVKRLLEQAVTILPAGLQYPDITAASIQFKDEVFQTKNYLDTNWKLTADRVCLDGSELKIHVVYLEPMPASDDGPFTREDGKLIDTIAGHLALKINQLLSGEQLQEKDRRLERMGRMSRIGYWEIDLDNDVVHWSSMTKRIHEVADDFIPKMETALSFYKTVYDRETIVQVINDATIKGKPYDVELQIITAKGNERWVRTIGEPQMNDEGVCVRLEGSFQDINERKRTQFESDRSRMLLETISDQTQAAIWVRDSEGRHIFVNKEWGKIFGMEDQQILGKTVYEVLDKATAAEFQNNDNKVLSTNRPIKYEERVTTLQGDRYYLTNMFPLDNIPGLGKGVAGFATDITERKANEEQIKNSLDEKELLLGEVHHRVKNNLAIISSLVTLQMMDVGDQNFRKMLEGINNRVHSIAKVHELLYQSENFSEIPLEKYIKDLLLIIKQTLDSETSDMDLVTDVNIGNLNINQAIPLGLMLNELMTNSLKYAFPNSKKGKITVTITHSGNKINVLYEDNGVGYPDHIDFRDDNGTFGQTLIQTLLMQLSESYDVETNGKFRLEFQFEERTRGAHSNF